MLPRVPEPEAMDSEEEAVEYDRMDHAAVNAAFVADFLVAAATAGLAYDEARPLRVLDAGTGTARIPVELARRAAVRVVAVDLSEPMLAIGRANVAAAGLEAEIELRRADCAALPFADGSFDAVMSNTIVHHLADPETALAEMARVLRQGGLLFVRDLTRPQTESALTGLVERHAAEATPRQRRLFADSLRAAWTPDEIRALLAASGLPPLKLALTSDRHWTLCALPRPAVPSAS